MAKQNEVYAYNELLFGLNELLFGLKKGAGPRWLTPIILATQVAEIKRIVV
jgi:hypothetical protein